MRRKNNSEHGHDCVTMRGRVIKRRSLSLDEIFQLLTAYGVDKDDVRSLIDALVGNEPVDGEPEREEPQAMREQPCQRHDSINPAHYKSELGVQCIDLIKDRLGISTLFGFCLGNAFKYLYRCKSKNKDCREDILKAKWYLDKLAEIFSDHKDRQA